MSPTLLSLCGWLLAASPQVQVTHDARGERLQVDGRDFFVVGVNWDYIPIGQNYSYSLWTQPDDVIEAALANELPLLKGMGVNAIRQYVGIPARWVRFIFERYGIFTVLNHPMGRYGATLDGVWVPSVDYSEPRLRRALKEEIVALVEQYRDTPGILLWLLGNENNYGLSWRSAEIEALPQGERDTARARHLYSLFGEVITAVKAADARHPVAIANGDVQYVDLIAELCPQLDVFGTNVYRGRSARDLFQVVHQKLHVPVLFTEFGADAFDAKRFKEDELTQARVLLAQWQELYLESAGQGGVGNAVGGFVFQWSDGWWKYGLESRLDIHDTNAGWPNSAYPEDFVEGENNMNEEWWGLCAKGQPDERGLFPLYPRAAYYTLAKVLTLDPYASSTTADVIRARFASVDPVSSVPLSRGDRAAGSLIDLKYARLSGARLAFTTFTTGGQRLTTPAANRGFDHLESVWADFQIQPTERLVANLSLNVVGNVPRNPIDELYYENHAKAVQLTDTSGKSVAIQDRLELRGEPRHLQRRRAAGHGGQPPQGPRGAEGRLRATAVVGRQPVSHDEVPPPAGPGGRHAGIRGAGRRPVAGAAEPQGDGSARHSAGRGAPRRGNHLVRLAPNRQPLPVEQLDWRRARGPRHRPRHPGRKGEGGGRVGSMALVRAGGVHGPGR